MPVSVVVASLDLDLVRNFNNKILKKCMVLPLILNSFTISRHMAASIFLLIYVSKYAITCILIESFNDNKFMISVSENVKN